MLDMAKKKKADAERVAAKLTAIAVGRLSHLPEEEQQDRIAVAEKRMTRNARLIRNHVLNSQFS